jgi:hypothetical protein
MPGGESPELVRTDSGDVCIGKEPFRGVPQQRKLVRLRTVIRSRSS